MAHFPVEQSVFKSTHQFVPEKGRFASLSPHWICEFKWTQYGSVKLKRSGGEALNKMNREPFPWVLEGTLSPLVLSSWPHLQRSSRELWGEMQLCCLPGSPLGITGHPALFQVFAVVSADTEISLLLQATLRVPPGDAQRTASVVQSELTVQLTLSGFWTHCYQNCCIYFEKWPTLGKSCFG